MTVVNTTTGYHAGAQAAFDAIPTPTTLDQVAAAQIAAHLLWQARGGYGCEHHIYQQTMRRVSAVLYQEAST